jgi:hypothetical protein
MELRQVWVWYVNISQTYLYITYDKLEVNNNNHGNGAKFKRLCVTNLTYTNIGVLGCNAFWSCKYKTPTFRRNILSPSSGLKSRRCGQYVSRKRWYQPTSPHGVTTEMANIHTYTNVRTSDLKFNVHRTLQAYYVITFFPDSLILLLLQLITIILITGLMIVITLWNKFKIANNNKQVRYQVLTAASKKMTAFWNIAPCSLVDVNRRFRDAYCLHHQPRRLSS